MIHAVWYQDGRYGLSVHPDIPRAAAALKNGGKVLVYVGDVKSVARAFAEAWDRADVCAFCGDGGYLARPEPTTCHCPAGRVENPCPCDRWPHVHDWCDDVPKIGAL